MSYLQVFFQDAALLRDEYPNHPAYQLDVFELPAWEKFAVDFKAAVQQEEQAYLNRDKEVKEQLQQLNARQHEMIEAMAKAFQQQQQKQEQLEKNQQMLLQVVQQQQQRQDLLLQVVMRQQQREDLLMQVVQQRVPGGGGQASSSSSLGGVLSGLQGLPIGGLSSGGLGGAGGVLSGLQGLPIGGLSSSGLGAGVSGLQGLSISGMPSGSLGGGVLGLQGLAATSSTPAESATSTSLPALPTNYTFESLYEWWLREGKAAYGDGRVSWDGAPRATFHKMKQFLIYLDTVVFSSSGSSSAAGVPVLVAGATPAANMALSVIIGFYQQQRKLEKGLKVTVFVTDVFMWAAKPYVAAKTACDQRRKEMGAALCEAIVAAGLSPITAVTLNKKRAK